VSEQAWHYEGTWRALRNTAAEKAGSIHADEPARKLGFRSAFVPGSVVGACALPALLDRFGMSWFDGGWYDLTFVEPVYTTDRVRAIGLSEGEDIACRVESEDGRLCCSGRAGLGYSDPWRGFGGPDEIFPLANVGQKFAPRTVDFTRDEVLRTLDAGPEHADCWESLIHPEHLMAAALHMLDWDLVPLEHVRGPGMWAEHAFKIRKPMPYGRYRMSEHLAEKGSSGRTHFVYFQFAIANESGEEVAVGRHKCKFIRTDL